MVICGKMLILEEIKMQADQILTTYYCNMRDNRIQKIQ